VAVKTIKLTVTIPVPINRRIEEVMAKQHKGRSAVVTEALRIWQNEEARQMAVQQMIRGYQRSPETNEVWEDFKGAILETMGTKERG